MRERISQAQEHLSDAVVVVKKHHLPITVSSGFILNLIKIPMNAAGDVAGLVVASTIESLTAFAYLFMLAGFYKMHSNEQQGAEGQEEDRQLLSNSRRGLFKKTVDFIIDTDMINLPFAAIFAMTSLIAIVLDSINYFAPADEDPSGPSDPEKINSSAIYGLNMFLNIGFLLAAAPSLYVGGRKFYCSKN